MDIEQLVAYLKEQMAHCEEMVRFVRDDSDYEPAERSERMTSWMASAIAYEDVLEYITILEYIANSKEN